MTDSSRLNIVLDPEDKALRMIEITLGGEGGGADLVCETPPRTNAKRLKITILRALGKIRKVQSLSTAKQWELVDTWLAAERVHRLFFTRASSLLPDAIEVLEELRYRANVDIWIIDPSGGEWTTRQEVETTSWHPEGFQVRQREIRESREEFEKNRYSYPDLREPLGNNEKLSEWPSSVASASFLGFLTACERGIPDKRIVGEIKREFHSTLKMFSTAPYVDGVMGYSASFRRQTLGRLRFALSSASSDQRAYIRLKAAQVYAFGQGFYIKHPDVSTCRNAAGLHPGLRRLRAFCDPNDAALGFVAFGSGLCVNDLAQIHGRNGEYKFGGLPLVVPEDCASIVRAAELNHRSPDSLDIDSDNQRPLLRFNEWRRKGHPHFSLVRDLVRVEEKSGLRTFNRNWPAQWGFRMLALGER